MDRAGRAWSPGETDHGSSDCQQHTVTIHVSRVLTKHALCDRVQAVILAYETGLITPSG